MVIYDEQAVGRAKGSGVPLQWWIDNPCAAAWALNAWTGRRYDRNAAGAIGLGILFVFTGSGHFLQTATMAEMLPPFVPARIPLVYLTGVFEWAIALGFLLPRTRRLAGFAAAIVLIAFFPANVYAAFRYVPMGGHEWGPISADPSAGPDRHPSLGVLVHDPAPRRRSTAPGSAISGPVLLPIRLQRDRNT